MGSEQLGEIYDYIADMLWQMRDQSLLSEMDVLVMLAELQAFLEAKGGDLSG